MHRNRRRLSPIMMRALITVYLCFTAAAVLATDNEDNTPVITTVILQGLNKVTGHTSKLEAPTGTIARFGTLEIVARYCWKSQPEDRPENAVLLDISELKPDEPPQKIFLGWMFSSSPGLSGLEHPVYDITVLACGSKPEI
jgi:hypothetical protein